jgi:hypothetical protein
LFEEFWVKHTDSLRGTGRISFSAILGAECDKSFQQGFYGHFTHESGRLPHF